GDIFHVQRDDAYQRQAEAEASFWDQPQLVGIDEYSPIPAAYLNERFTGDPTIPWFETLPNYGAFHRGCALGAGGINQCATILLQNPDLHLTVYDISGQSLEQLDRDLNPRFGGRLTTQKIDLNFVELPQDAYDVVVSDGCIHHLYNLEHVAYQVNRSLTPDGYFFLVDYVGESRFQFSDEQKRTFEQAFAEARQRFRSLRGWRIVWPAAADWDYSPFEAARSGETLDVFRRYLAEVDLRTAGALVGLLLFVRKPAPLGRPRSWSQAALRRLASLTAPLRGRALRSPQVIALLADALLPRDREIAEAGTLRPTSAFALYRKKPVAS
ncbi:MAG: class I SAM-dependent methyltransferase, partial [Dehalococcoidia bacterium]